MTHCTVYPIELAWAQVKGHIKANNCAFTLNEVERLMWEGDMPLLNNLRLFTIVPSVLSLTVLKSHFLQHCC